jgi:hypothetical protein
MKPLSIILMIVMVGLLISPAMAIKITAEPLNVESTTTSKVTGFTYDGTDQGLAIQRIGIDAPSGTHIDFTITYGNGDTVTGSAEYTNDGFYQQNSEIVLGGETSDYHFIGLSEIGRFYVAGYAINDTPTPPISGLVMYGSGFGVSAIISDYVFYPTATDSDGVMYKIVLTSNRPVDVVVMTNPRGEVATAKSKGLLEVINEWVNFAIQIASTLWDIARFMEYWLRFFFWQNLIMTVALYIAITGAMAFNNSSDIFVGIGKFFKMQKNLYDFIIGSWKSLVDLVAQFRSIFRL